MEIIALGLSHKTAAVDLRERLHVSEQELAKPLDLLGGCAEVFERMILSTCNRVEVYAVVADIARARDAIEEALASYHAIPRSLFRDRLYLHASLDAVRHVFRVASSLDSLVVGEPQILGQVKTAYTTARQREATGVILNTLLERALNVAKRVRTETGIGQAPVSISSAAVELARKIFGELSGRTVMVLGAGEMAELAVTHLLEEGARSIIVANRSHDRARGLAARFGGRAITFADAKAEMLGADIVLCSTGAPHIIFTQEDIQEVIHLRRQRPIFLIDIAVPRDIDPRANAIDNVYLYDIDDLQTVVADNLRQRQREGERAEAIIEREVTQFGDWLRSLEVVPTIVSLRKKIEAIREAELQKALDRLPDLPPEERQAITHLTEAIVNKILHHPLTELKRQSALTDGHVYVRALRRLFKLDDEA